MTRRTQILAASIAAIICVAAVMYLRSRAVDVSRTRDDIEIDRAVLEHATFGHSTYVVLDTSVPRIEEPRIDQHRPQRPWDFQWEPFTGPNLGEPSPSSNRSGAPPTSPSLSKHNWAELGDSLKDRDSESRPLARFAASRRLTWITQRDLDVAFDYGGWDAFHKRYPGVDGVLHFGSPGYSTDGLHAIVYFSTSSGGKGGEGKYFLLDKISGQWRVLWVYREWIS